MKNQTQVSDPRQWGSTVRVLTQCVSTPTKYILLRIRARRRAIGRVPLIATASPTGRTIQSWLSGANAGTLSRVGLQPHHGLANFLPAQDRVTRRISIYLSTCAGSLLGGRTSAQVGLGHEPLKRSVPFCSDNRAGIIADLTGSDSIERVFKT